MKRIIVLQKTMRAVEFCLFEGAALRFIVYQSILIKILIYVIKILIYVLTNLKCCGII